MSKYAMLNCWNDLNKGDLGIMLATVAEIQNQDSKANIIGVSSFSKNDEYFKTSHVLLKKFVPDVVPGMIGILGMKIGETFHRELPIKIILYLFEKVRHGIALHVPVRFTRYLLTKDECETLDAVCNCDVCFSKGGSVFTDYKNLRGSIALERTCRFFKFLKKFEVPYYILGQSFGPIKDKTGIADTNYVIKNAQHVFIREKTCIAKYPELNLTDSNVSFSNDAGFLIKPIEVNPNPINKEVNNVGLTVRGTEINTDEYIACMVSMITYLITEKKCHVHIFQQVAMKDEPDNVMAEHIIHNLTADMKESLTYHTKNYLPQELCWLYGQMDAFIGTRLHSTIFSMTAGTPALGLVYHGTKTQGIFSNIGVPELVLEESLSFELLKERFDYLWDNREVLKKKIEAGVMNAKNEMRMAIALMVEDAKRRNKS